MSASVVLAKFAGLSLDVGADAAAGTGGAGVGGAAGGAGAAAWGGGADGARAGAAIGGVGAIGLVELGRFVHASSSKPLDLVARAELDLGGG